MELDQALKGRRSTRFFKEGSIDESQINEMICAANMAPSWKNSQTPHYYIAHTEEAKDKVRAGLPERNAEHTKHAVALIVFTFEKDVAGYMPNGTPDNEVGNGWGFFDNGLACQNLLLKAYEMGYGTLVMGIRDETILRKNLQIPSSQILSAVISVGVADINPKAPTRKDIDAIATYID